MSATLRIDQVLNLDSGHQVYGKIELAKGIWEPGYYRFPFTFTTDGGPSTPDAWWYLNAGVINVWTDFVDVVKRYGHPVPWAWLSYKKVPRGTVIPALPTCEQLDSPIVSTETAVLLVVPGFILTVGLVTYSMGQAELSAMKILAMVWAAAVALSAPLALVTAYLKDRRRRIRATSSGGAPMNLPQPTVDTAPKASRIPPLSDQESDATDQ